MMGVESSDPNTPPFVIVNVPPVRSSITSLPSRAFFASSTMSRPTCTRPLRSASLMLGTTSPASEATAMPRFT